jgi:hypothetical protein
MGYAAHLMQPRWYRVEREPMAWTIEEIEREWLGGSSLAASPQEIIAAFERCELVLGRDWIEARYRGKGAVPTLAVVRTGQWLASLEVCQYRDPDRQTAP